MNLIILSLIYLNKKKKMYHLKLYKNFNILYNIFIYFINTLDLVINFISMNCFQEFYLKIYQNKKS